MMNACAWLVPGALWLRFSSALLCVCGRSQIGEVVDGPSDPTEARTLDGVTYDYCKLWSETLSHGPLVVPAFLPQCIGVRRAPLLACPFARPLAS